MPKSICTITLVCDATVLEEATRNFVSEPLEHCLKLTRAQPPQLLTPWLPTFNLESHHVHLFNQYNNYILIGTFVKCGKYVAFLQHLLPFL